MASIFCKLFEENVVPMLCHSHTRPNNKPTTSERKRLSTTFSVVWFLPKEGLEDREKMQEDMAKLDTKGLFLVREVTTILMQHVPEAARLQIAYLKGDRDK
jgi:hypothetical protein